MKRKKASRSQKSSVAKKQTRTRSTVRSTARKQAGARKKPGSKKAARTKVARKKTSRKKAARTTRRPAAPKKAARKKAAARDKAVARAKPLSGSRQSSAPPPDAPAAGTPRGAPWIDVEIQQHVTWRDGDIVVSVPVKSGTTWTMNIVHQLREGGDSSFEDLYAEVPWLELVHGPSATREQRLARFDEMPRERRRAFKTHSPPGPLPYHAPGAPHDIRYVVVVRNPDEAMASLHPFAAAHSDAWFKLWQIPREAFVRSDFRSFYYDVARDIFGPAVFGFVAAWWPLRHSPNVLLLHYTDMKRDHEGAVRRIAEFLGFEPQPAHWPRVLEYTSFAWMKANERKFEIQTVAEVPILDSGGMVRKGKAGAAHEDGMTPEISADLAELGRSIVLDPAAFAWCYRGGPLPD